MSGLTPRLVVLTALLGLAPLALFSACGGESFQGDDGNGAAAGTSGGSNSQSGSGQGGSVSSGGGKAACGGPEHCDDGNVCTTDLCTIEGSCASASRCSGPLKCCEGDCAECCEDADCDDAVGCTTNTCFAGKCMFLPDDTSCGPNEYCSVTESCRPKIACGPSLPEVTCADSSPCTTDGCAEGFCKNQFCEQGTLCCEAGCADECCDDTQCDTGDPCSVGVCSAGKCSVKPLCEGGAECCPSPDDTSASCGSCCSAADCDDGVACTDDVCTGAVLSCGHHANSGACQAGQTCSPTEGCVQQVDCDGAEDCKVAACGRCVQGHCQYDCPNNQPCCPDTNVCAACCGDASCDDGIACTVDKCGSGGCSHTPSAQACPVGYQCEPNLGGCVRCTTQQHCDDGDSCTTDTCVQNECAHVSTCECTTTFQCTSFQTKIARPVPPGGTYCPSCVDGKCQQALCYGVCCSSGCYPFGLCPD